MSSTLSLSCSKKLYGLLGDTYETGMEYSPQEGWNTGGFTYPRPDFSETIRLLPRIAEKKGWERDEVAHKINIRRISHKLAEIYVLAPTEEEGMKLVSNYLEALL